jgi:hypothetical protein
MSIRTIPRNKIQQKLDESRKFQQSITNSMYSYGVLVAVWDGESIAKAGDDIARQLKRQLEKYPGELFADVVTFVDGRLKTWLLPFSQPADAVETIWGNAESLNGRLVKIQFNNNDISTGVVTPARAWGADKQETALVNYADYSKNADISGIL